MAAISLALNPGRSSGLRLVMRLPSTTALRAQSIKDKRLISKTDLIQRQRLQCGLLGEHRRY
jgi:hypothetical protein